MYEEGYLYKARDGDALREDQVINKVLAWVHGGEYKCRGLLGVAISRTGFATDRLEGIE